jgi:hypothetical protein
MTAALELLPLPGCSLKSPVSAREPSLQRIPHACGWLHWLRAFARCWTIIVVDASLSRATIERCASRHARPVDPSIKTSPGMSALEAIDARAVHEAKHELAIQS